MNWRANQDALIDAGIGPEDMDELPEPRLVATELDLIVNLLAASGSIDESGDTHPLSDRQATVGIWIDGHEYSLTLNRED